MWRIVLSHPLNIFGLVGSYPTNYLILFELIKKGTSPLKIYRIDLSSLAEFSNYTHPFAV